MLADDDFRVCTTWRMPCMSPLLARVAELLRRGAPPTSRRRAARARAGGSCRSGRARAGAAGRVVEHRRRVALSGWDMVSQVGTGVRVASTRQRRAPAAATAQRIFGAARRDLNRPRSAKPCGASRKRRSRRWRSYNSRHAWRRPLAPAVAPVASASATARPDPARRDAARPRGRDRRRHRPRRGGRRRRRRLVLRARLRGAQMPPPLASPPRPIARTPAPADARRQRRGDRSRPRLVRLHRLARPARADPRRRRLHQDRQGRLRRACSTRSATITSTACSARRRA